MNSRSDNKKVGINKSTFAKFFELPGIIAERLWSVFDQDKDDYLNQQEFCTGMTILFCENYDKLVRFIFYFYDFDKDGLISKEDIRTVLSYVPLNPGNIKSISKYDKLNFKDRVASQEELYELLNKCFAKNEFMDINAFINTIENVSSDIFLFILIFLLECRPFSKKTLDEFNKSSKFNSNPLNRYTQTPQISSRPLIMSPSMKSAFSPSISITKSPFIKGRELLMKDPKNAKNQSMLNMLAGRGGVQSSNNLPTTNKSMNALSQFTGKGPVNLNKDAGKDNKAAKNVMSSLNALKKAESKKDDDAMQVDENVTVKPIRTMERKPMKYLRALDSNSSPNKQFIDSSNNNSSTNINSEKIT